MARPLTVTKERILSAALDLVRSGGPSALTARSLCTRLDCGANAIFSSFGSIQGVRDAVREEARKLYRKRVGDGFALNPPFKGFGVAFIWFAMDEPRLFSMIMESRTQPASYKDYIDSHVGFKAESLSAIAGTFGLHGKDAETLYGPGGEVDSYVLMQALVGQNHLLQGLRARPRYILDEEWTELERMLRNSCDLTPESLREAHPDLTKGDIRTYILSHLQFSVSEQAILLGISPASVTKARQRLKAKLLP